MESNTVDNRNTVLTKKDIMAIFKCENNKALKILKLLFQMGFGLKIGKGYYTTQNGLDEFIKTMAGKKVVV